MEKKNVAIVGYGGMGSWHADKVMASDVCSLSGIYDIKKERNLVAKEHGIHVYSSFDDVLSDKKVDIVTVAVPNDIHEQIVVDALNAGKNVICEKPVTLSVESLKRMIDCANKNGKLFSAHQNRRWDVDFLAVKEIKESGTIGKIFNVESRIHGSRGIPSDWRGKARYGGGMLYDWGIHLIDQALMLIDGKIKRIYCTFDHITNDEVDDGFKLTLTFEDSSRVYVEVGTYNFIGMPRFYFQGSKGTGIINDWRENCKLTKCKYWNERDVLPVESAAGLTKTMAPRDEITVDYLEWEKPKSDVHDYYRNFVRAIDGKEEQIVTHAQMIRDLEVIEAAFRSEKLGQVVEVEI